MFQPGFGVGARLVNFLYKGVIFAGIGMAAGLSGTAVSNSLLALRCKLDPSFVNKVGARGVLGRRMTCTEHVRGMGWHAWQSTQPGMGGGGPWSWNPRCRGPCFLDPSPPNPPHRMRHRTSWPMPAAGPCTWASPPTCGTRS